MVSIEWLNKQIAAAESYVGSDEYYRDDEGNRKKKRKLHESTLKRLVPIRNFLQDGLTEEYLIKDKARIEKRLKKLNAQFANLYEKQVRANTEVKKQYEKDNDYSTLRRHLQNINFILTN